MGNSGEKRFNREGGRKRERVRRSQIDVQREERMFSETGNDSYVRRVSESDRQWENLRKIQERGSEGHMKRAIGGE